MSRHRTRPYAVLAALALAVSPLVVAATPAAAAPTTVTLVGSLQSEFGCAEDWDPACAATHLAKSGTTWTGTWTLPAGSYEFKVAINDAWTENYGAGGAPGGANIPITVGGPAKLAFSYDEVSHVTTYTPLGLVTTTQPGDAAYAKDSLRSSLTRERFYFVMADRFANGNTTNDNGGLTGGKLTTGFDPSDKAFYHGGDLAGITQKLDYIKGMGTTAIWLTPSFKNKPVQGKPGEESAGYHGYWITDFTQIDPHLGTNADMKALIDAAHAKGMKVFFDIITNHTADVIDYREGAYTYRSKKNYPYKDASGTAFDDRDYVNKTFPAMDPATSFPYTPFLHAGDENAKTPAWLNDVNLYHNRGDSTFAGESSTYGDFIGLDDLFTERPEVVSGMGDIYKTWVDFGIDGFRIDTVKHVNLEFWQKFIPDILGEAQRIKNDDFFAFGEVYDGNPEAMSQFTTSGKLQATLDFGFQQQGVDFAKGKPANVLADFFAKDDWYTDADSNAYQLPTFLGNHDMGRVAMFLKDASASDAELMQRVKFADALMYTVRGNPVTYYGDEQGFIGTGGDQLAREDLFASKVAIYNGEKVLGGPSGSMDRYSTDAPLYTWLRDLAKVRAKHPALADGAQVNRYAADGAGIFAVSRYDKDAKVEYVVAANNATTPKSATFPTWTSGNGRVFTPVLGTDTAVKPAADGKVTVTVPPLTVSVWRANKPVTTGSAAPTVSLKLAAGSTVAARAEVGAEVTTSTFAQTTVLSRLVGASDWTIVGTDDNAPFRVFHDVSGMPVGSVLEYRAVTRDAAGRVTASGSWAVVGKAAVGPIAAENGDPVPQPSAVSVPGTHNSEMGCPVNLGVSGDWAPNCDQAQLTLSATDQIWKGSYTLPPGTYAYKAAINRDWTYAYGLHGGTDNIPYETPDGKVSFYYDHATHWVTSDEEGPIITAPGSFGSEVGCTLGDWKAECMRPWLQDKDGDGIYTFSTTLIPAGTWDFKIAHGLSWTENYGEGGVPDGPNIVVSVPTNGATTTIAYDSATHRTTVSSR
jgi:glycosidase